LSYDARRLLPTKINLIRLRRERASLRRVRDVLVEKRNAILLFIRAYLEEYERLSRVAYSKIKEAERLFGHLAREMGYDRYAEFVRGFQPSLKVVVRVTTVFTVKVPTFTVLEETYPDFPTLAGVPLSALEALKTWRSAFSDFVRVIELEQTIRKLIQEVKKTQRLINALDNIILPTIERAIAFIKMVLDERNREEFVRTKYVKRRLERAKEY